VTEFQKLLDLIQTSGDLTLTGSPLDFALSSSSGEELEKKWEAEGGAQGSQDNGLNGEDTEQNRSDSVRSELPDCVLDWKADDSLLVKESSESMLVQSRRGDIELVENSSREGIDPNPMVCKNMVSGSESTDPCAFVSYPSADSLKVSGIVEANVCQDGQGISNVGVELGAGITAGYTDNVTHCTDSGGSPAENRGEAVASHIGEVGQSPASEGSVDTKGSTFSGGSQERKQRQGRRSGKQCKLALTFTQNCPSSASKTPTEPTPNTTTPSQNSSHYSIQSDADFTSSSDRTLSLNSKDPHDPCPDPCPDPTPDSQTKSHPWSDPVDPTGCPTQTDPQDFAVLWRVNQHHSPDDTVVTVGIHPSDIVVLTGDPFHFVPAVCSAASAANAVYPPGHCEVPYRMAHEKGTQVEEMEFGVARSRLENLRILSRHFKLVSFDILEDLYDKCHQDLEWTTNLLLDSGERFFRDDDDGRGQGYVWGEDEQDIATLCDTLEKDLNIGLPSSANDESHPGDRPTSEAPVGVEANHESVSAEACSETLRKADESSGTSHSNTEPSGAELKDIGASRPKTEEISGSRGGISSQDTPTNGDHVGKRSNQNKSPQPLLTLLRNEVRMEGGWDTGQEVTSEPISKQHQQTNSDERMLFDILGDKYGGEELSDMDEMTRLLLAELEESDKREEEQKLDERNSRRLLEESRSRHMDIRSLELKLPTELALQLTELFGPVGVDPGSYW